MTDAALITEHSPEGLLLRARGPLVIGTLDALQQQLPEISGDTEVVLDLGEVDRLDTAGAWLIADFESRARAAGGRITVRGGTDLQNGLLETVRQNLPKEVAKPEEPRGFVQMLEQLGRATAGTFATFVEVVSFFGAFVACLGGVLRHPSRLRLPALVFHMQEVGLKAVPIVVLMAFLIGVVLAFQGATQLRQFGAEIFVVDLIAISILRELGILLTSIIVAGRSGAAFTSAIGSMKMREEIDAMHTLGIDPMEVLVLPRVLALILMLPVLGFIANIAGLLGGALMSWIELGVAPAMFKTRLVDNVDVVHFVVGMTKAPFFAVIIGIIGCYQGMKVEGNAESLGQLTSTSVVQSIFMVIVVDAIFSVFFAIVGV